MRSARFLTMIMLVACTDVPKAPDPARPQGPSSEPAVTVGVTERSEACAFAWNGQNVTNDELLDRSVAYLVQFVESVGGPASVTFLPTPGVAAADSLAYRCVGIALGTLARAGFGDAFLMRPGQDGSQVKVDFPLLLEEDPPALTATLEISPSRLLLNGADVAEADLQRRAADLFPERVDALNGAIVPTADAPYVRVWTIARAISDHGGWPGIIACRHGGSPPVRQQLAPLLPDCPA